MEKEGGGENESWKTRTNNRPIERQTERQNDVDKQSDRQADRHADRLTNSQHGSKRKKQICK